jgi:ABC-type multidrug transport system ATPase subunit
MSTEEAVAPSKDEPKKEPEPARSEEATTDTKSEKPSSPPPSSSTVPEAPVELIETPGPKKRKKKNVEIAIRITKVTKRFGVKTAVDGVSLKIRQGQVYGLIGPNGAGKTTTFSMLAGFLKSDEGAIEVLGYAPDMVDELRSRLGVLPQDALLPPTDKVGEFLVHMAKLQDIPADRVEAEAREVLAEVDGRDWWGVRCSSLSHGMAKRVQLAQALLGDPEVVLLDEPTAGLDPRVAYEVRQLIKKRKGRHTIVVSSHNLQELEEICDGACILDRGRVVASGAMSELTAASEEIHVKIAGRQDPNGGYRKALTTVPVEELRKIQFVTRVELDDERSEVVVYFDRKGVDAETIIGQVLWMLLNNQVRISAVSKGRGLEQRVMELTD